MSDLLVWCLIVALSFAKLFLYVLLIVAVWVWIKKHSPKTAEQMQNYVPFKKKSK